MDNMMILGEDRYYSLDCYQTQLNNNVLVVGASGTGKTRSIVSPNLLAATGSYIVTDPKGNLYKKYSNYLKEQGYIVKKLDFTDPAHSSHYSMFKYIRNTQDIVRIAHMLVYGSNSVADGGRRTLDPFWDEAAQLLIQSVIAYLYEACPKEKQTFHDLLRLIAYCQIPGSLDDRQTRLDLCMCALEKEYPESYAVSTYKKFRIAADKTLRSIMITVNAHLGIYDTPELDFLTAKDTINIDSIGKKKTALFVIVSDTDRSLDGLVNIFFTQAMSELCRFADKKCEDNMLPVPVRFILDDFATNCRIEDFPRMISSIRSRGISTMIMIQAESQLTQGYGEDGRTIIGNCDTYVYLGGNDVETAKAVAERCDLPPKKILNMPVGSNWIFRRGQAPLYGSNYKLETFRPESFRTSSPANEEIEEVTL